MTEVWDERAQRYRDTETGRFTSGAAWRVTTSNTIYEKGERVDMYNIEILKHAPSATEEAEIHRAQRERLKEYYEEQYAGHASPLKIRHEMTESERIEKAEAEGITDEDMKAIYEQRGGGS